MNICIGGPLNGIKQSELFKKTYKKDYFNYENTRTKSCATYYKAKIKIDGDVKIFWIIEELMENDINNVIKDYNDIEI